MNLTIKCLFLAVMTVFSQALFAKNEALPLLLSHLASFTQYQASFEQQTLDDKGVPMQTLLGSLVLQKPNLFYWQADEPAAQKLVSDGKTIWHFDEDLEQVIVQAYADQKQQSPLLLILEDEASLSSRFDVSIKSRTPILLFSLHPKDSADASNTIASIELGFKDAKLSSLHFVDVMKQKVIVEFSDIVTNQTIDKTLFNFEIPLDADVLYE